MRRCRTRHEVSEAATKAHVQHRCTAQHTTHSTAAAHLLNAAGCCTHGTHLALLYTTGAHLALPERAVHHDGHQPRLGSLLLRAPVGVHRALLQGQLNDLARHTHDAMHRVEHLAVSRVDLGGRQVPKLTVT